MALLLADVTETRRLEAVRRDFVANVCHELKTPVGALTLLAEAVAGRRPTTRRRSRRVRRADAARGAPGSAGWSAS